jgi:hypothetical protein
LHYWGSETDRSCRVFIVEAFHCLLQWFIIFLFLICLMLCSWCCRSGLFGFGARCVFSSSREIWGLWWSGNLQFREKGDRSERINIAVHKSQYVGPWLHSWSSWQLMTLSSLQSLSILLQKLDAVSAYFLIVNMKRWTELDWHGEITVLLESDNQQGYALEIGFGLVVVWNSDCIASKFSIFTHR